MTTTFDPEWNCPTHFAGGDPTCPACISKQPRDRDAMTPTETAALLEEAEQVGDGHSMKRLIMQLANALRAAEARLQAIDDACAQVCPDNTPGAVGTPDEDVGRYVCQGEDGTPLIDTDDPAEVVRRLSELWALTQGRAEKAEARAQKAEQRVESCRDIMNRTSDAVAEGLIATPRIADRVEFARECVKMHREANTELPWVEMVERRDDMALGRLRLIRQDDGDVCLAVISDGRMADVEFCTPMTGGGRSPHTWRALIRLAAAMERDRVEEVGP